MPRDPGATVCRDLSGNLVFFASEPNLRAGLPHGYLKIAGNWILFNADSAFNVGALPDTPEEISRDFPDLLAQAAAFNTKAREELLAVIQAKTIELITSIGFQNLGAGIWGIALPQDTSSACETLKFNVSDINIGFCPPPNCLDCPKPNPNGGMVLSGSLTGSCPPEGGIGTGGGWPKLLAAIRHKTTQPSFIFPAIYPPLLIPEFCVNISVTVIFCQPARNRCAPALQAGEHSVQVIPCTTFTFNPTS